MAHQRPLLSLPGAFPSEILTLTLRGKETEQRWEGSITSSGPPDQQEKDKVQMGYVPALPIDDAIGTSVCQRRWEA